MRIRTAVAMCSVVCATALGARTAAPSYKCLVLGPGLKATLTDSAGKNPKDVTENLVGEPIGVGKGTIGFTYFDDYTNTGYEKAEITIKPILKK